MPAAMMRCDQRAILRLYNAEAGERVDAVIKAAAPA